MRVVVTGGRNFGNAELLHRTLDELHGEEGIITLLVTGSCPTGADFMAENWAKQHETIYMGVPARWKTGAKKKGEGMIRNGLMLDLAKPDIVIAFPGGAGTSNCVLQAHKKGIPVKEVSNED